MERLQAAGIRSYNGLMEQILKKPSCVIGLPMARLDQITEASQVILVISLIAKILTIYLVYILFCIERPGEERIEKRAENYCFAYIFLCFVCVQEKRAENYWKTRTSSKEKHSCNAIFVLKR